VTKHFQLAGKGVCHMFLKRAFQKHRTCPPSMGTKRFWSPQRGGVTKNILIVIRLVIKKFWLSQGWQLKSFDHPKIGDRNSFLVAICKEGCPSVNKKFLASMLTDAMDVLGWMPT